MWVRGLKLGNALKSKQADKVAPYVGAWIETVVEVGSVSRLTSHPMWVRGLKRGSIGKVTFRMVAPYVGAWIETIVRSWRNINMLCRTLCGCVD